MNLARVQEPARSVAFTTAYPFNSMVYAARTDEGIVVIDLGWARADRALERRLKALGARPEDVRHVFLTHAHRDHIAGWQTVRRATFHLSAAEVARFQGDSAFRDVPSRVAAKARGSAGPWAGEVAVEGFSRDTAFVLGADTLRAFLVPGHTPGSAAYLFRGVLFVGDAVRWGWGRGWRGAAPVFTEDGRRSRESVRSLWERTRGLDVQWVCTAHAKCSRPDTAFLRKALR